MPCFQPCFLSVWSSLVLSLSKLSLQRLARERCAVHAEPSGVFQTLDCSQAPVVTTNLVHRWPENTRKIIRKKVNSPAQFNDVLIYFGLCSSFSLSLALRSLPWCSVVLTWCVRSGEAPGLSFLSPWEVIQLVDVPELKLFPSGTCRMICLAKW